MARSTHFNLLWFPLTDGLLLVVVVAIGVEDPVALTIGFKGLEVVVVIKLSKFESFKGLLYSILVVRGDTTIVGFGICISEFLNVILFDL